MEAGPGAPLGVILDKHVGLGSLGLLTALLGGVSFVLAMRKSGVPVTPGEHLPFRDVLAGLHRTAWRWRWAGSATACLPPA